MFLGFGCTSAAGNDSCSEQVAHVADSGNLTIGQGDVFLAVELPDDDKFASGMSVTLRKEGSIVDDLPEGAVFYKVLSQVCVSCTLLKWITCNWACSGLASSCGYSRLRRQ